VATFLVFEPTDGKRTPASVERVVFLREKFSPLAFIFTPFWLLIHRLWLGFLIWLVVFIAINWAGSKLGFGPYAVLAASFFPSLLFGMEAVNLRARKLLRNGYRDAGVVIADDIETAELKFFETWKTDGSDNAPVKTDYPEPPSSAPPAYPETKIAAVSAEPGVIGLFPTPGAQR
jgi:hypothetical protein